MIYLKNPLCLGMEESEYKEMLALGGMRQKHFEKNEVILSAGCTTQCMLWAWCCAAPSTSKISTCGAAKAF